MRIVQMEAENVKRLRAVRITPHGAVVPITGRNAQGKTSVLDAIAMALGGERLIPTRPVRDGEESARVRVDLGEGETVELIVERRWSGGRSTLSVRSPAGAAYPKAQGKLNDLVGALTFDPLAFTRMDPKKQAETLRTLAGLDFARVDAERASAYDARRAAERDRKFLEAQAAGIVIPPECPSQRVDVAALMAQYEEARTANARRERMGQQVEAATEAIATLDRRVEELQKRLDAACADLEQAIEKRRRMADEYKAMPVFAIDPIRDQLASAEATNAAVDALCRRADFRAKAEKVAAEVSRLTGVINKIDAVKARAIADAALPIDGLGLSEDGVTYQGVPFDQCSSAEQLRVSVAMGLALNPTLRIMLIRDGSLLDAESMAMLEAMAAEHDAQVWIELVTNGDGRGIVIEDGEVVGADAPIAEGGAA